MICESLVNFTPCCHRTYLARTNRLTGSLEDVGHPNGIAPSSNPTMFTKHSDEAVSRSCQSQLNIIDTARLLNWTAENN